MEDHRSPRILVRSLVAQDLDARVDEDDREDGEEEDEPEEAPEERLGALAARPGFKRRAGVL